MIWSESVSLAPFYHISTYSYIVADNWCQDKGCLLILLVVSLYNGTRSL